MTRYELLDKIGAGGMAEVFRGKAVAAGGFEKPVAIKRILPHLSKDERFVDMLIAEAKILAHLRHRNIVQIFDVGLGSDGQYFLVMEYLEGTDLGALQEQLESRGKRLPVHLAVHVCAEVCEALEHAHRVKGPDGEPLRLVHRDVSPSNVLISWNGEIKLTDFGIAKRREEHTGHGGVRGKFAYISPEQSANAHVDARSDVFSLGIILYELVLGHRLYSSMRDVEGLRALRAGNVQKPSEVDRNIDPELEGIILRALALRPDDRFATAGDFGSTLRKYRYTALTGGDPAKDLADILRRSAPRSEEMVEEPTVVRISTAAGFTADNPRSFADARALLDAFEEEETRAMSAPGLSSMLGARPMTDLSDAETRLLDTRRNEPQGSRPPPIPDPVAAPPRPVRTPPPITLPPSLERAATPTVRELFYQGELLDRDTPGPGTARAATDAPDERTRPRRGNLVLMALAAVVVAAMSFIIAATLLGRDRDPAVAPDAGPAETSAPASVAD
jgi:eukaryotic-like serine/threonine-protein kinase